jgi:hypothetical protein
MGAEEQRVRRVTLGSDPWAQSQVRSREPVGETFRCREQRQSEQGCLERVSLTGTRFLTGFRAPNRDHGSLQQPTIKSHIQLLIIITFIFKILNFTMMHIQLDWKLRD